MTINKTNVHLPSANVVLTYLCIMGVLASLAVAVMLLLFLAYLLQCLLLSVGELVHTFTALDPLVRLLLMALVTVLVAWRASFYLKQVQYGR